MNLKSLLHLLCLSMVVFALGCGAHRRFDLGIPASKSESFFFHMKAVALQEGYTAQIDEEENTLSVQTKNGSLIYKTNAYGDGLEVQLTTRAHQNNSEIESRWLADLEKIHDRLLAKARVLSKGNQIW